MKTLFALLIATATVAATLDEQIAAANAAAKAASALANKLGSQKTAAGIDSLYQLDAILADKSVRVVGGEADSMWVKVALNGLITIDQKLVRVALGEAKIDYRDVDGDTLYMHWDSARRAVPVISKTLK
jgi:hypothetical protein